MAIITKLEKIELDRDSKHTDVEGTYAIVEVGGKKYLQIDTYGSAIRKYPGRKSQSLRFNQEAIDQLRSIIDKEF
jgi:hypothetical protein